MPRVVSKKASTKKRTYAKRKASSMYRVPRLSAGSMQSYHGQLSRSMSNIATSPFASRKHGHMDYVEIVTLTSGNTGLTGTEYVFRLNSLYDPNFTAGGHQPYGFDQFNTVYNKYKVTGVSIEVMFVNAAENTMFAIWQISSPGDTRTTNSISPGVAFERPNVAWGVVNSNIGEQTQLNFKQYVDIAALSGLTKQQFIDDNQAYASDITTNPAASPFLRLNVASGLGSSGTNLGAIVKFRFWFEMWDRQTQTQS